MLVSTQSNSNDYSIVRMNLNIPWEGINYVNYYVSSINTKANMLMTTKDDYLLFMDGNNNIVEIKFIDSYSYTLGSLVKLLNACQTTITFSIVNGCML